MSKSSSDLERILFKASLAVCSRSPVAFMWNSKNRFRNSASTLGSRGAGPSFTMSAASGCEGVSEIPNKFLAPLLFSPVRPI